MILIAAAGTGGHIYPALAVAEALEARGVSSSEIVFVTSSRKVEDRIFSSTNYRRIALPIGGLAGGLKGKAIGLVKIVMAAITLRRRLANEATSSPLVLIMFGGYISAVARIGLLLRPKDVVVVETNSVMGRANRIFRLGAKATFAAFSDVSKGSGVPLRNSVLESLTSPVVNRQDVISTIISSEEHFGRFIVAFGGSLGARTINQSVLSLLEGGSLDGDIRTLIYLVVGERDFAQFSTSRNFPLTIGDVTLAISEYDDELIEKIKCCDCVISRAGSNTVAELAALSQAAVLIPLPTSPNDHQKKNALWYRESGRGVLIEDDKVSNATLRGAIYEALNAPKVNLPELDELNVASKISSAVLSLLESL